MGVTYDGRSVPYRKAIDISDELAVEEGAPAASAGKRKAPRGGMALSGFIKSSVAVEGTTLRRGGMLLSSESSKHRPHCRVPWQEGTGDRST